MELARATAKASGVDPERSLAVEGAATAHVLVENLRVSSGLPGGLTRTNLLLAVRTTQLDNPLLVDGVTTQLDGGGDPHVVEGGTVVHYELDVDGESGRFIHIGPTMDLNGHTPVCAYSQTRVDLC